ncbi:MAG: DNA polymerase III subunit gamma/tau [Bacteriovoracaceae bacterium]|nr:DNA polymerase III subunit gamma/tau [Bacteriovoracaceae bacterium]
MNYQVLARKWRPQKFQDVIGQNHVVSSLQNAILRNKLGHAYIFSGTRGVGKTTVARIFAKSLRCAALDNDANPCGKCNSCQDFESGSSLNVIEIDGASNNGVDNIRELINNVHFLPTSGKYKIYIIDEVHMVTVNAFNALLKTLEAPPAHVIFIFATTEPHKLLATVLSRCQRFDFRNVNLSSLIEHVKKISEVEKIAFDDDKLIEQMCLQGNGSVRDTLSLFDQVLSFSENNFIDEDTVVVSLGIPRISSVRKIVYSLLTGDVQSCSKLYRQLLNDNVSTKNILKSILDDLFEIIENYDNLPGHFGVQSKLVAAINDISQSELFWVYEALAKDITWVLTSIDPEKVAEIVLQKICLRKSFFQLQPKTTNSAPVQNRQEPEEPKITLGTQEVKKEAQNKPEQLVGRVEDKVGENKAEEKKVDVQHRNWETFIEYLFECAPASASNLEQGNILSSLQYSENSLKISVGFDKSSSIFFDYLQDVEVKSKIISHMSDYFKIDSSNIIFNLVAVDEKTKKESNFKSIVEIKETKREQVLKQKKEDFLNHPVIKEAEGLFNAKINKVIIEET